MTKPASDRVVSLVLTGNRVRLRKVFRLSRPGQQLTVLVFISGSGTDEISLDLQLVHTAPETISRVLVRGGLSGRSRADFAGTVRILPGAKKADARLESRFLLLSRFALAKTVPNLEISQADAVANHTAVAGSPDKAELFYLMSRGLSGKQAEKLVISGFWESMISLLPARSKTLVRQKLHL